MDNSATELEEGKEGALTQWTKWATKKSVGLVKHPHMQVDRVFVIRCIHHVCDWLSVIGSHIWFPDWLSDSHRLPVGKMHT